MSNPYRIGLLLILLFVAGQSYAWFGTRKKHEKEQVQHPSVQQVKDEKKDRKPAYHGVYSDDRSVDSLLIYAHHYLGRPYRGGATGPYSFDCSGFTSYCYRHLGYNLVHSSAGQTNYGMPVMHSEWQPGDLVFFNGSRVGSGHVGHVGIVVRNNGDGTFDFIHAACSKGISVDNSAQRYYAARYVTARRLIGETGSNGFNRTELDNDFFKSTMMELNSQDDGGEFDTSDEEIPSALGRQKTSDKELDNYGKHKVRKGETLSSIARQYGCTVEELKQWNNLSSSRLYVGRSLKIRHGGARSDSVTKQASKESTKDDYEVVYDAKKDQFMTSLLSDRQSENPPPAKRRQIVTTYVISSSGETTVTSESLDSVPEDIPAGSQDYSQNRQSLQRSFQDSEKGMEFSTAKSIEKGTSTESSEVSAREEKPRTPSFDQTETHIVKVGETLYSISQRYGCSITQLEEWNGLTTTAIRPGQRLKVHLGEQKTSPIGKKSTAAYHTVQKGETYYSIAQKYRTSVRELQQLNGSRNSSLQIGQKIRVK